MVCGHGAAFGAAGTGVLVVAVGVRGLRVRGVRGGGVRVVRRGVGSDVVDDDERLNSVNSQKTRGHIDVTIAPDGAPTSR